jgi:ankyrin repeat protein
MSRCSCVVDPGVLGLDCMSRCEGIVKMLLGMDNIDVNAADTDGWTPLLSAIVDGRKGIVDMLLAMESIDINIGNRGESPLGFAMNQGAEILEALLKKEGLDVEAECGQGWTPQTLAKAFECEKTMKMLLGPDSIDIDRRDLLSPRTRKYLWG